jgi:hypothetical protein
MKRTPASAGLLLAALLSATSQAAAADEPRPVIAERFASKLQRLYIFPARANAAAARIRANAAKHAYDTLGDQTFARALTADAGAVLRDKHVHVFFNPYPLALKPDPLARPSRTEREAARRRAARAHFGFAGVHMLRGDIGYIDVRSFTPAEYTGATMAASMRSVAGARAIIIDERLNMGGDPNTVAMLESYFFPMGARIHLDDMSKRTGDHYDVSSYYTSNVAGPRFPTVPLYILTSKGTFSAGEALAYDLQALKRAAIVGGSSLGGANGGAEYPLSKHFSAFIPIARPINPITHTNWERAGVQPDIVVPFGETFKAAYLAALRRELDTVTPQERSALSEWIASVEHADAAVLAQQLGVLSVPPHRPLQKGAFR